MTLNEKIELVRAGKSSVYNNWNEATGIEVEDFIAGLEWMAEEPTRQVLDKFGKPHLKTRYISVSDGKIKRVVRTGNPTMSWMEWLDTNGQMFINMGRPMINNEDDIR